MHNVDKHPKCVNWHVRVIERLKYFKQAEMIKDIKEVDSNINEFLKEFNIF